MSLDYDLADVRAQFGRLYPVALALADAHAVRGLRADASESQLEARVEDGGKIYAPRAWVSATPGRQLFDSDCNCESGGDCVHVAAMLLQALKRNGYNTRVDPWQAFLQQLCQPQLAVRPRVDDGELLRFILDAEGILGQLLIRPVLLRRAPNGRLSSARDIGVLEVAALGTRLKASLPLRQLVRSLADLPLRFEKGRQWAVLTDQEGEQLLESALSLGAAHWLHAESDALRSGPARPASLRWQLRLSADQELSVHTTGGPTVVFKIDDYWYSDGSSIGRVEGERLRPLLAELPRAPSLKDDDVARVNELIDSLGLGGLVPRATPAHVQRHGVVRPEGELRLTIEADPGNGGTTLYQVKARLQLCYGSRQVQVHPPMVEQPYIEDEVLHLQARDLDVEAALRRPLESPPLALHAVAGDGSCEYRSRQPLSRAELLALLNLQIEPLASDLKLELAAPADLRLERMPRAIESLVVRGPGWFEIGLKLRLHDDAEVDVGPLLTRLLRDRSSAAQIHRAATDRVYLDSPRGVLCLNADQLRAWLVRWEALGPRRIAGGKARVHAAQWARWTEAHDDAELSAFREFADASTHTARLPDGFVGQLRPYQVHGLGWLQGLDRLGLGGVLADDMGLGKTVQVLCHLKGLAEAGRRPSLLISPLSLLENWRREVQRFVPGLKVFVHYGAKRDDDYAEALAADVVLTTHGLVHRDLERLATVDWQLLVIDEAQAFKNPDSQGHRAVRQLRARSRIALSGTPLENHLGELKALIDLVEPELLGSDASFRRYFQQPIERDGDADRVSELRSLLAPFVLRRTKQAVLTDLPPKLEVEKRVTLGPEQRAVYERVRQGQINHLADLRGVANNSSGLQAEVLEALLRLRQVCCDPALVIDDYRAGAAKIDVVVEMLTTLSRERRGTLVFSQFASLLERLAQKLNELSIAHVLITGQTRDRQTLVDRFQQCAVEVALISLKAGGVGLNLSRADTVIHIDPWWNPAAEDQATDRAHRIGQQRSVFVYRLVADNTVEERMLKLKAAKQSLRERLLDGPPPEQPAASVDDLMALLD